MTSFSPAAPLVLINAVGLTGRWLPHAPRLAALAQKGGLTRFTEVLPAVTTTAQATLLTGYLPSDHGIVGNGWLFRETGEVRFWQQSNTLLQKEPFYATAARRAQRQGKRFRASQLFWWFNQGARVDFSLTPKPWYGADGDKRFGISGQPQSLATEAVQALGEFPFPSFWGPRAGYPATEWIARAAAWHLEKEHPDLLMVYLPHLDYDPQRLGTAGSDMKRLMEELDRACIPLLDACAQTGAVPWVVSEYGHFDVNRPIFLNRALRKAGMLEVRDGPFGEILETFQSRAFAVADHQLAHVYVRDPRDLDRVAEIIGSQEGVASVCRGEERAAIGLNHSRAGEIIALSKIDSWFAYPYWLDDSRAPDFARTVDIHRKPGYDPCELFVDPAIRFPMLRVMRRLAAKKLGFRTLFDLIPLDASLVKGSHGLQAPDPLDRPVWIGGAQHEKRQEIAMTQFRDQVLLALGLADE